MCPLEKIGNLKIFISSQAPGYFEQNFVISVSIVDFAKKLLFPKLYNFLEKVASFDRQFETD